MIMSKDDYRYYLKCDSKALGRPRNVFYYFFDEIWVFQRALRRAEFHRNTGAFVLLRVVSFLWYKVMAGRLGFTIPLNVFGPGLSIAHRGTIVVNAGAKVGKNCRIHVCVNIGTLPGHDSLAPSIGDNCYIGPGAKIYGPILIGNDCVIGANAVVNKSFSGSCTIAGVPASVISQKSSDGLFRRGAV
jgi:serine O-acetyltransferase